VEEEDEDEGVSSQLTLQALAGNLQRMNSLWGPQEARLVPIGFLFFYGEGTSMQEEAVRYLQRMNSLWGPQEDRLVPIGFLFFYDEGTAKREESVRYSQM
jgi:hypothetical protein